MIVTTHNTSLFSHSLIFYIVVQLNSSSLEFLAWYIVDYQSTYIDWSHYCAVLLTHLYKFFFAEFNDIVTCWTVNSYNQQQGYVMHLFPIRLCWLFKIFLVVDTGSK